MTMTTIAGKTVRTQAACEALAQLKQGLDQWRAERQAGARIPAPLWNGAVEAAAVHGAWRVARELNLDYAVLRRRAALAAGDAPAGVPRPPRFVELFAPAATSPLVPAAGACVVELANARGAKMRVELHGSALAAGLPALCNAFWGA